MPRKPVHKPLYECCGCGRPYAAAPFTECQSCRRREMTRDSEADSIAKELTSATSSRFSSIRTGGF